MTAREPDDPQVRRDLLHCWPRFLFYFLGDRQGVATQSHRRGKWPKGGVSGWRGNQVLPQHAVTKVFRVVFRFLLETRLRNWLKAL